MSFECKCFPNWEADQGCRSVDSYTERETMRWALPAHAFLPLWWRIPILRRFFLVTGKKKTFHPNSTLQTAISISRRYFPIQSESNFVGDQRGSTSRIIVLTSTMGPEQRQRRHTHPQTILRLQKETYEHLTWAQTHPHQAPAELGFSWTLAWYPSD